MKDTHTLHAATQLFAISLLAHCVRPAQIKNPHAFYCVFGISLTVDIIILPEIFLTHFVAVK